MPRSEVLTFNFETKIIHPRHSFLLALRFLTDVYCSCWRPNKLQIIDLCRQILPVYLKTKRTLQLQLGIPIQFLDEIMAKDQTITTASDVLVYVPNLIGYARVLCAVSSFLLMICTPQLWLLAILLYLTSFVGDLIDGWAARRMKQCSSFGGVLDMVTDRCSTAGLLFVLAGEYSETDTTLGFPVFRITFLALLILDISSHWVQMHSSFAVGAHHKSAEGNKDKNFLVRWFYQYYWFFGYLCVGAEFTYILMYTLLHMPKNAGLVHNALQALLMACVPGCLAKQAVNVAQLSSSCRAIAQYDADTANKAKD